MTDSPDASNCVSVDEIPEGFKLQVSEPLAYGDSL